ncbi:MAG TPA: DUF1552 domain-containing protein [Polyangiaceae bacterium]|nr:DUF1552 domain-containing protein [Polyangiaceae bacterium]
MKRPFVRRETPRSAARRSFLRAVGVAATALPFYQLLEDSFAHAAGETLPLKFLTISHPHGIASEYFGMRTPSSPDIAVEGLSLKGSDTETSFDIAYPNCSLQPFDDAATYGKSFKDRLLVIEGLDLAADGHDAVATILTGTPLNGGVPSGSSLDQYLAVEQGLGAATRKSNVVLSVGSPDTTPASTLSYSKGGVGVGKIISPLEAFDYLFGGFVPPDDAAGKAALARKNALGQSVVDYVRQDCNRLRARLAPPEQQKMDQHLAAIRDLEKTFSSVSSAACAMVPKRPTAADFPVDISKLVRFNGGEPTFDVVTTFFVDLLAQAFACDVTRFGTLVLNDLPWDSAANAQTDSLGFGLPSDFHNNVAHKYQSHGFDWQGKLGAIGDATSWLPLAKYNKYVYGKVARLVQKLDEAGALDSSLVYVTSELGNPNLHTSASAPTVLLGGKNVPFRFGRRLQLTPDCAPPNDSCKPRDAKFASGANNHLLVSIAQAFGVETNQFGSGPDSSFSTGALSGLT